MYFCSVALAGSNNMTGVRLCVLRLELTKPQSVKVDKETYYY